MTRKINVLNLRFEWRNICEAMSRGTYRGTEAEALARIETIKAEIAKLEGGAA